MYSSVDLLREESLEWCGIGARLDTQKRELGFEPEEPNPNWTLHPLGLSLFTTNCGLLLPRVVALAGVTIILACCHAFFLFF